MKNDYYTEKEKHRSQMYRYLDWMALIFGLGFIYTTVRQLFFS